MINYINLLKNVIKNKTNFKIYFHNDFDGWSSNFLFKKVLTKIQQNAYIISEAINYCDKIEFSQNEFDNTLFVFLDLHLKPTFKQYILIDHHSQNIKINITENIFSFISRFKTSTSKTIYNLFNSTFDVKGEIRYTGIKEFRYLVETVNKFDTSRENNIGNIDLFYGDVAKYYWLVYDGWLKDTRADYKLIQNAIKNIELKNIPDENEILFFNLNDISFRDYLISYITSYIFSKFNKPKIILFRHMYKSFNFL